MRKEVESRESNIEVAEEERQRKMGEVGNEREKGIWRRVITFTEVER